MPRKRKSKTTKTINELQNPPAVASKSHHALTLLLILGWILISLYFLGLQNFHPVFNVPPNIPPRLMKLLGFQFFLGAGFIALMFLNKPESNLTGDIGRNHSRMLLLGIMALTAFMRLYQADSIPGHYWDDFFLPIEDGCQIADYHKFSVFGTFQDGEPLYGYVLGAVLYLFPKWDGLLIQRLVATGFDLFAVWIFYLLGKEFGKRRIGILMASFGAMNKPMIMMIFSYMRFVTIPAFTALSLLFSLRLFKKPNLSHFIQWGATIAVGYYTYTAYRLLGLFIVFAVLAWVLFRKKLTTITIHEGLLGSGLAGIIFLIFIYQNRTCLNPQSGLKNSVVFLAENGKLVIVLLMGWIFWEYLMKVRKGIGDKILLYYTISVLLIMALVYPIFSGGERVSSRLYSILSLSPADSSFFQIARILFNRVLTTFNTLFHTGLDREDINIFGDPYFGVADLICVFPGLIYVLFKPSWKKTFILLTAFAGLSPHIFADPGGNRLVGCIVPLLLIGALGFDQMFEATTACSGRHLGFGLGVLAWLGLLSFGSYSTFEKSIFSFQH